MKDTNSISDGNFASPGGESNDLNIRPPPQAEAATAGNEHDGNGREANDDEQDAIMITAAEPQQQTNGPNESISAASSIPVQTPSERLLIKMSVQNSNVAVGQGQSVEQLSVEDRVPPPTTSGTTRGGATINSLEKAESDKQCISKNASAKEDDVYDDKVWYALGITVAQRLVHLKQLTRMSNDGEENEWNQVVSGIVDSLRISGIEAEEKQSEMLEVYQDDVRQLVETRIKRQQQASSSATVNESPHHPSDASFGVFGSAISTVSSLQSVEEEKPNHDGKNKKALANNGGDVKTEKARLTSEASASDDILRFLLYPDCSISTITADRPNSPLIRDASNTTNNTTSASTPGAFRVRSMAHGPNTVERARAGDSASREHSYSYTNQTRMTETFGKGQDICVEAVACDDGDDVEQQQVVVIAKEVTVWQQLRQPKILAVIGCLILVVVAIAVPITMKANSKAPPEDVELIIDEDEDKAAEGDMPTSIFPCNFTEQYTKLIGKGLADYDLPISTSWEDAIKWLGDRMTSLNSPIDQFAFCEKDVAGQPLMQTYALASIFFSSSPSKQTSLDPAGTKVPFCDKEEGAIGWPISLNASEDVCDWEGVDCNSNGTVHWLDLSRRGWGGTIPNELLLLGSLTRFDLSFNGYEGTIPSIIGRLENLSFLDLSANDLTGAIPSALGNLTMAYEIYLDGNNLSNADVPEDLCKLRKAGILANLMVGDDCSCCSYCPSASS